jgi:Cysteine rich repeat
MRNLLILSAVLVLSSGGVLAADQPQGGPRAVCKDDVAKLCPGIQPGGGRIVGCLKQNESQVSAACKDAIAKGRRGKAPGAPASSQG